MRSFLKFPRAYLALQYLVGAMSARQRLLADYANLFKGMRILDIGCGPGYVVKYLPDCNYVGFDLDENYIAYAKERYDSSNIFNCGPFDAECANRYEHFDLVMMNGLLHHLVDDEAKDLVNLSRSVLKKGGMLLTLDGCYKNLQSSFIRYLLKKDRGGNVRYESGYRKLLEPFFTVVESDIRSDLSMMPYTYIVMRCKNV